MAEWDQGHDHDHDLGKEIDVDPEVENIFDAIEKEIEVDHGETNLHQLVPDDMIGGMCVCVYIYYMYIYAYKVS